MPRYYRVHSRVPLNKPTLSIGAHVPSAGGYIETFTELKRSKARAEADLKAAKKNKPFGTHTLQQLVIDAGVIQTDKGIVAQGQSPAS